MGVVWMTAAGRIDRPSVFNPRPEPTVIHLGRLPAWGSCRSHPRGRQYRERARSGLAYAITQPADCEFERLEERIRTSVRRARSGAALASLSSSYKAILTLFRNHVPRLSLASNGRQRKATVR